MPSKKTKTTKRKPKRSSAEETDGSLNRTSHANHAPIGSNQRSMDLFHNMCRPCCSACIPLSLCRWRWAGLQERVLRNWTDAMTAKFREIRISVSKVEDELLRIACATCRAHVQSLISMHLSGSSSYALCPSVSIRRRGEEYTIPWSITMDSLSGLVSLIDHAATDQQTVSFASMAQNLVRNCRNGWEYASGYAHRDHPYSYFLGQAQHVSAQLARLCKDIQQKLELVQTTTPTPPEAWREMRAATHRAEELLKTWMANLGNILKCLAKYSCAAFLESPALEEKASSCVMAFLNAYEACLTDLAQIAGMQRLAHAKVGAEAQLDPMLGVITRDVDQIDAAFVQQKQTVVQRFQTLAESELLTGENRDTIESVCRLWTGSSIWFEHAGWAEVSRAEATIMEARLDIFYFTRDSGIPRNVIDEGHVTDNRLKNYLTHWQSTLDQQRDETVAYSQAEFAANVYPQTSTMAAELESWLTAFSTEWERLNEEHQLKATFSQGAVGKMQEQKRQLKQSFDRVRDSKKKVPLDFHSSVDHSTSTEMVEINAQELEKFLDYRIFHAKSLFLKQWQLRKLYTKLRFYRENKSYLEIAVCGCVEDASTRLHATFARLIGEQLEEDLSAWQASEMEQLALREEQEAERRKQKAHKSTKPSQPVKSTLDSISPVPTELPHPAGLANPQGAEPAIVEAEDATAPHDQALLLNDVVVGDDDDNDGWVTAGHAKKRLAPKQKSTTTTTTTTTTANQPTQRQERKQKTSERQTRLPQSIDSKEAPRSLPVESAVPPTVAQPPQVAESILRPTEEPQNEAENAEPLAAVEMISESEVPIKQTLVSAAPTIHTLDDNAHDKDEVNILFGDFGQELSDHPEQTASLQQTAILDSHEVNDQQEDASFVTVPDEQATQEMYFEPDYHNTQMTNEAYELEPHQGMYPYNQAYMPPNMNPYMHYPQYAVPGSGFQPPYMNHPYVDPYQQQYYGYEYDPYTGWAYETHPSMYRGRSHRRTFNKHSGDYQSGAPRRYRGRRHDYRNPEYGNQQLDHTEVPASVEGYTGEKVASSRRKITPDAPAEIVSAAEEPSAIQVSSDGPSEHGGAEYMSEPTLPPQPTTPVGLRNDSGENSCFINVIIQSFSYLPEFKQHLFTSTADERTVDEDDFQLYRSVVQAMQKIENSTVLADNNHIPISMEDVRDALARTSRKASRFTNGHMNDAVEAFEAILSGLTSSVNTAASIFDLHIVEQRDQAVTKYSTPVLYVPTHALQNAAKDKPTSHSFSKLIQEALAADTWSQVAQASSRRGRNRNTSTVGVCLEEPLPSILALGLVWDSLRCSADVLLRTTSLLPAAFQVNDLLSANHSQIAQHEAKLRAIVCFQPSRHHYIAFIQTSVDKQADTWFCFNDAEVEAVGSNAKDILMKSAEMEAQPCLLFYEISPVVAAHDQTGFTLAEADFPTLN